MRRAARSRALPGPHGARRAPARPESIPGKPRLGWLWSSVVEPAPRRLLRPRRSSPLRDGPDGASGPDNAPLFTVGPVRTPLAFDELPCAGSCARSPHPSPASGAPGPTASSGASPQALRGVQPLRARPVGASVNKASLSSPPRRRLRSSGPAGQGCWLAGLAMAAANWAVTSRARHARRTRRAGPWLWQRRRSDGPGLG